MRANLEERLQQARPNTGGPTLKATSIARERALAALPSRSRRTRLVAAALVIAAATAAVVAVELRGGAGVASAARVRAAVSQTLASASELSGTLVINEPEPDGTTTAQRWSFAVNSAGDLRLTGLDTSDDLALDAETDTLTLSRGRWFSRITGFPPPTNGVSVDWMLERELGAVIAALAAAPDTQVEEVHYDGRPAWLLTLRTELEAGKGTLERRIMVDRALALPVHDVLTNVGSVLGEWRLENLRVDGGLSPDAFALEPRADQEVRTQSEASRRVAPSAIEAAAGYAPLVAGWLPEGYRFDHAALSPSYTAAGVQKRRDIATFVYRRGLEEITVTMAPREASPPGFPITGRFPVTGPFCTVRSISAMVCANTHDPVRRHQVILTKGALSGQGATIVIDVAAPPTLTAETPELAVQISGDADEVELTRIAESFRQ